MNDVTDLSTLSGLPREAFADAVFNRYAERLMRVARERLGVRLQSKVSPEDVVQSAFKSFFRRQHEFEFQNDDSDGLWGLLVVMTIRKCAKWADVFGADKRSTARETSLDAETASGHRWHEAVDRGPSPEEAMMLSELIERLMQRLDARQQQMLALRMQGFELEEIADQVQSSRRTVARVIAEVKRVLREFLADDA
ncbi:MAG: RNA polymerase sigma factor [Planctomycetaceae bacterium]